MWLRGSELCAAITLALVVARCEPQPPLAPLVASSAVPLTPTPDFRVAGPPTPPACVRNCIVVADIELEAWFVRAPPGRLARATVRVTDETGAPLSGIELYGRFVDDEGDDTTVSGQSGEEGIVLLRHAGPPRGQMVTFLVHQAEGDTRLFDGIAGVLVATARIAR